MKLKVGCVRAGVCIASILSLVVVFAGANAYEKGSPGVTSVITTESVFLNGSTASRLVADVSAIMIAVDGKIQPEEVEFAYKLGQDVRVLISGQGLWPVTEDMLSTFSTDEYEAQLKANLREIAQDGHGRWSAHRMADGAYEIMTAAKALGEGEVPRVLVAAASNVWAKQTFMQRTPQETHEHIKQRERVNSYF